MGDFKVIQNKLEQFIKKYYTNELLKGAILFFAIGLLYFLATLFIEYVLWLSSEARTILFWLFIIVELGLLAKFLLIPLAQLLKLRRGIDHKKASQIIGNHFPEVNDKLFNILQLKDNKEQSDLLLASIAQKSKELQPIPFQTAVDFRSNIDYLKYAAIPVAVILLSYTIGKKDWFSDSYERVVNYKTAYEPPAPFQFFVVNETLSAIENKDFKLLVRTVGNVVPDNASIRYNGQTYFLQQTGQGEFQYTFKAPKSDFDFELTANDVTSKPYRLEVVEVPTLLNFDMVLDYPAYTGKQDETLKSSGNAIVPEGTNVTWIINTRSTSGVSIYAEDTLAFNAIDDSKYTANKRLFSNFRYVISTSNVNLKDYEQLAFSIKSVKDAYPELSLKVEKDSIDGQSLYFLGRATDDYGISKINLVYYPEGNEETKIVEPISTPKGSFSEFVSAFPNQFNLKPGVAYELYFEVFDNDAIHNFKRIKSNTFTYRKLTKDEEETKQLQQQNEAIEGMNKTFEKLEEQNKTLDELSKTQKEKETLNFNDKKKFENFLKRQKEQEALMKNFNKRLQDNLEEFQKDTEEQDQFKEDLKERLKENEEQLKEDEKLLEELEKMKDKINKEEFSQKLEELAKQNQNKKRSMEQLLELTKRFYVTKKAEKISKQLEELSQKQEQLSEDENKNTKEAQEQLNKDFEDIQKGIEELKTENRKLRQPMDVPRDPSMEKSIQEDQKTAKESLQKSEENEKGNNAEEAKQQKQNAQKKQKSASQKMKQMSEQFKQMMQSGGGAGGQQMQEDAEMLRQILDNLILFSFDQEDLMDQFKEIDVDHNQYGKFIVKQNTLKEHFEHVDDSLFALSLRNPKLSEQVNKQITEVYFNMDKALEQLSENRIYQGTAAQQYTVTASNELSDFLSNVLDNMEMQMNMAPGQGQQGEEQLQDIIISQEELTKKMEEALKKAQEGKEQSGEEGEKGDEGEKDGQQEGKESQQGKEGQEGKQGQKNGQQNAVGENGQKGEKGKDGKKQGYGEGGNEELNGELYRIFQQQQQIRQALEDKIGKEGSEGSAAELIKQMEEVELDLINKGFTNQTLQKMMDLQHQLLKLENATFLQGEEEKRESKTNFKDYDSNNPNQIPTAKSYFNTVEILNRQALPLREQYKKKVQTYFKNTND